MLSWTGIFKKTTASPEAEASVLVTGTFLSIGYREEKWRSREERSHGNPSSGVPLNYSQLDREGQTASSDAGNFEAVTLQWKLAELDVRYIAHQSATVIRPFPGEPSSVIIPGRNAFDQLTALLAGRQQPWFKKDSGRASLKHLLVFVCIIAFLIALYLLLVPFIAGKMASTVSVDTEEQFGESIFQGLHTDTDIRKTRLVNEFFSDLDITTAYRIRIAVVNSAEVDAFALPGGRMVIYTGLLDKLQSYPQLAALISHEFIHVQEKHATKSVFRRIGSKVFLSLILGRTSAVAAVLADQADELKSLGYSRSLEKEADLGGLAIMQRRKIDPAGFTGLFNLLAQSSHGVQVPEMLASHPEISQRITYVTDAARGSEFNEDTTLHSIFNQLKNIQP